MFIHHRAHKTPRLPRVRPSCLIKCVTLKRTETHAVASGTKPGLFTYCVTMLMRGWEASQQAGRHHCPTVWSGGAQTPLRLPLPHPSTSLTSLLHAQLIQCCLHNSNLHTPPITPSTSLPPPPPSFESHSEASLSSSCIVLRREAQ